ncbi:30S ribosomal protein S9 [Geodia barretti]|nr:30S ribosomal protein S9 [Geodia barretti]
MGKRKTSVAQVRLYTDTGINQVNGRPLEEVFPWDSWQQLIRQPFRRDERARPVPDRRQDTRRRSC